MGKVLYEEKLTSLRTELAFICMALISFSFFVLSLYFWSLHILIQPLFFSISVFFLFYTINYRVLHIRLTSTGLQLKFGLLHWQAQRGRVEGSYIDDVSLWRIGGAGIHLSPIHKRYRLMFNFLEHPRVVINLKKERISAVMFSTKNPSHIIELITKTLPNDQSKSQLLRN